MFCVCKSCLQVLPCGIYLYIDMDNNLNDGPNTFGIIEYMFQYILKTHNTVLDRLGRKTFDAHILSHKHIIKLPHVQPNTVSFGIVFSLESI